MKMEMETSMKKLRKVMNDEDDISGETEDKLGDNVKY
jgi:hypothetical protein